MLYMNKCDIFDIGAVQTIKNIFFFKYIEDS